MKSIIQERLGLNRYLLKGYAEMGGYS